MTYEDLIKLMTARSNAKGLGWNDIVKGQASAALQSQYPQASNAFQVPDANLLGKSRSLVSADLPTLYTSPVSAGLFGTDTTQSGLKMPRGLLS